MLAQCCAAHHARCHCVTSTVYIYTYVGRQLSPVLDDRWSWVVFACLLSAVRRTMLGATASHRLFTYIHMWGASCPQSWMTAGRGWSLLACSVLCGASCSVLLRHPRWGVPCVRPWEPYRLLDNEQPCDWNRTRELACLCWIDRASWTADGRAGPGDL